ncbi:hypothetical protein GCM10023223_52720 [Stackebrandtia albiflava]
MTTDLEPRIHPVLRRLVTHIATVAHNPIAYTHKPSSAARNRDVGMAGSCLLRHVTRTCGGMGDVGLVPGDPCR